MALVPTVRTRAAAGPHAGPDKTFRLKSHAKQWGADQMAALAIGTLIETQGRPRNIHELLPRLGETSGMGVQYLKAMNLAVGLRPISNR